MSLTFKQLRTANVERLGKFRNKWGELVHAPDGSDWSPAQWFQAAAGELGEYANWRKKYERGDMPEAVFMAEAGKELADVVIYLDLLAYRLGIDLDEAVRRKFNEVSDRVKAPVYLEEVK